MLSERGRGMLSIYRQWRCLEAAAERKVQARQIQRMRFAKLLLSVIYSDQRTAQLDSSASARRLNGKELPQDSKTLEGILEKKE
jgi:hypothetical protein